MELTRRSFTRLGALAALGWRRALARTTPTLAGPPTAVAIRPAEINYLMADRSQRSDSLKVRTDLGSDVKRFWVEDWRDPLQTLKWRVQVEHGGSYEVTLMVRAPESTGFTLHGPKGSIEFETDSDCDPEHHWYRLTLPSALDLPAGASSLEIRLNHPVEGPRPAALKSIELLNVNERPKLDRRIAAFRSSAQWLGDAKFGVMTQCGEWSYPPHGPHRPWPQMVEAFDVEKYADMVHSTGAGYVVWSATWRTYFFPAPIKAIDRILPGRTSERDLIGEMAVALSKRNIRQMLYYHLGHDQTPENGSWWSKNWASADDKALFFDNWCSIISEIGLRYKSLLAGWLFDDELAYYPAPYERLGDAAKNGYAERIISYNPWIQPRGTDFQDFQFGEGSVGNYAPPVGAKGVWSSGPHKGLHAHSNFILDGPDWGIFRPETLVLAPLFTQPKADEIMLNAAQREFPLSWNVLMYDDGSISPASLAVLQGLGKAIKKDTVSHG